MVMNVIRDGHRSKPKPKTRPDFGWFRALGPKLEDCASLEQSLSSCSGSLTHSLYFWVVSGQVLPLMYLVCLWQCPVLPRSDVRESGQYACVTSGMLGHLTLPGSGLNWFGSGRVWSSRVWFKVEFAQVWKPWTGFSQSQCVPIPSHDDTAL